MSLEIKQDEHSVFVATDPDIPGLLVVSKDRDLLVSHLIPKAIADLEIARLTKDLEEARASVATHNALVYCVTCIEPGEELRTVVHIFSTPERAQAFCDSDPRPHVISDYVIDCPERMEQQTL